VILCPNHTGRGAPAALDPSDAWRTPLGDVPVNRRLAARIAELAPSLEEDAEAHRREHSLEVQLPFLQVLRPDVAFVPICLGEPRLGLCREIGEALAKVRAEEAEPPLLLASSDMNHYESRDVGRGKDDRALARVESVDAEGLFRTVLTESISMCGFLPATALLFAARAAGAGPAATVARRDSGDETGDTSSVVGYAGVVINPKEQE
jgi:AmmeMemoRadiSam system protein B